MSLEIYIRGIQLSTIQISCSPFFGLSFLKKHRLGSQNISRSPRLKKLPKIVNCATIKETSKEEDMHQEPTTKKEEMDPTISCNALVGITTPQTLKI